MAINTKLGNETYVPQGASVVSGVRAGNFYAPNDPVSAGIPIGNVYGTFLKLYKPFDDVQLFTGSVPANSTVYVDMTSHASTLPTNATLVPGKYVEFDWSRDIYIDGSQTNYEVFVAGYDLYDEKVTWGAPQTSANDTDIVSTRAYKKLTAIQLTNNADTSTNFTISLGKSIELPYYDFGCSSHFLLLNYSVTNDNTVYTLNGIVAPAAPSGDNQVDLEWVFKYYPAVSDPLDPEYTLDEGLARPQIQFDLDSITYTNDYVELLVKQVVYGYGTLPDWVKDKRQKLLNNKISIMGPKNYNKDWVAFQG